MDIPKHRVFISFHHGFPSLDPKCGEYWKNRFEQLFHDEYEAIISHSVQDGDINDGLATETTRQRIRDGYIRDATVTVVLIGPETWKRKHVDWEISSSIRHTLRNSRCGLLGILLPTYPDYNSVKKTYESKTVPPRLFRNIECGYATIHAWSEDHREVRYWIHEAFDRRFKVEPTNSYPLFSNNRGAEQKKWY
jgi:MTH538 TIR-like domain (DUF1863)